MLARTWALILLNITIFDISFLQFKLFSNTKLLHSLLINLLIALALKNMTSQKTWPHPPPRRDSHQHWPFLVVENNEDSHRRLRLPQTKENVWNRFRFLKKHFMFLEELNRRIRENGINLRLSCIYYLFLNISRLSDHCHKTQLTSLTFRICRIYLVTQTTLSGILESLSHSSQLQRLLFTISR